MAEMLNMGSLASGPLGKQSVRIALLRDAGLAAQKLIEQGQLPAEVACVDGSKIAGAFQLHIAATSALVQQARSQKKEENIVQLFIIELTRSSRSVTREGDNLAWMPGASSTHIVVIGFNKSDDEMACLLDLIGGERIESKLLPSLCDRERTAKYYKLSPVECAPSLTSDEFLDNVVTRLACRSVLR